MVRHAEMIWIVAIAIAAAAGTAACTIGSDTYISSTQDTAVTADAGPRAAPSAGGATGDGGSLTCSSSDFVKADLATLTACGDGKGHCFAKTKIAIASLLTACPDAAQVCVPDEILVAGGQPLKSCTSIIGPGGCVTATLIPQIIQQGGSALKPDICSPTQLCVPCNDPRTPGATTPFCQPIGVHEKECSAGAGASDGGTAAAATPCCTTNGKSNGVCIAETAVPEAQRSKTKQDVCAAANKCVPAAFVAGTPVKCGGLLGDGVCMDKCFNDMMSLAGDIGLLGSKGCGTTEVCVPCSFVSGQGVPGCK